MTGGSPATKPLIGAVLGLAIAAFSGGEAMALAPAVRVWTADGECAREVLLNGGFEQIKDDKALGWEPVEHGYSVAEGAGRDGGTAIHCRNDDGVARLAARQLIELNQTRPLAVVIRGWSRAENVDGDPGIDYSLYTDRLHQDGSWTYGQTANFSTGTHAWEYREVTIIPAKPIKTLAIHALLRGYSGQAWFDDISVREMSTGGAGIFDTVPIRVPEPQPDTAKSAGVTTTTPDGLAMGYHRPTGRVTSLTLDGEDLVVAGVPSGFLVRDVAAGSHIYAFEHGNCSPLGLDLSVVFKADAQCIRIAGRLTDRTKQERALTLYFAIPVDAIGWRWHDDIRRARPIETGREYANVGPIGTGAGGNMSVYPLACISGPRDGLALGLDMDVPGQRRIAYSAVTRQFFIAYDLGLSPATKNFPSAAPFSLVICRTEADWGFRAAAQKFYDIFPQHFICRSEKQGIWVPPAVKRFDASTVSQWRDFGFRYHEGATNTDFNRDAGILSFRYSEPAKWWMWIDQQVPRTHENVMKALADAQEHELADWRRHAAAVSASGIHDAGGQIRYNVVDAPWCKGAVFSMNPSPYIPGESEGNMRWNDEVKRRFYGPRSEELHDGEYLDGLDWPIMSEENFRGDHFRHVTVPLTFSTALKRPVIHSILSKYEFTRRLAEDLHDMGKLTFANGVPRRFPSLAPWIDVMGQEVNSVVGEAERWLPLRDPELQDEPMSRRRMMAYKKPYLMLVNANTSFEDFTPDMVEGYFQRCLFYGFWPSMFTNLACDQFYWQTPELYNRDRHLFKRYIPLVRRVAETGWEPITHAVTDNEAVYVERFGPSQDPEVYFTLLNDSWHSQDVVLTIDAGALGLSEARLVQDMVAGEHLAVVANGARVQVTAAMAPEQVRLIHLSTGEGGE